MMKQIAYSKILLLMLCCLLVIQADAKKRKKKKKKTKAVVVKVDSPKVVVSTPTLTIDSVKTKNQETKPLAQLVVSFVSRGYGIDGRARNEFLALAEEFNTKHNIQLMYDVKPWGREGEMDYCFIGNNEILMLQFYAQLKEKLGGYNRVFIKQNTPCK